MSIAPHTEELRKYADELLTRLWTTKAVRFEASRRFSQRDSASRLSISFLSLYVIAVTVIDILLRSSHSEAYPLLFNFIGVVAPVLILVLEAYEGGKHYLVRSDRMHRSAQQVQVLHDRLERFIKLNTVTPEMLEQTDHTYQGIMRDFEEHHENIDYMIVRAMYPHRFQGAKGKTPTQAGAAWRRFVDIWAVPICILIIPGVMLVKAIVSLAVLNAR